MTIIRRTVRRWVALAVTGLLAVAGCALLPPEPVPLVPFTDFSITTTGGIAGIYRELRISADGDVLVLSDDPRVGRIGRATLDRLRTLLESEGLRRDVARLRDDRSESRCSDAFQTTLRMGELVATGTDTCGLVPTPALDELDVIVQPFWKGFFEEPLPEGPRPPRIVVQAVQSGQPTPTRIELEGDRATLFSSGTKPDTSVLDPELLAVLQVLAAAPPCRPDHELDDGYRIRIGDQPPSPVIGGRPGRTCPELSTIAAIALDAVDA
ncbi:hypothetical protein [Microlunatus speluncae]|uniref:hypothetical protein n=1 Tax=Microlunatus speluncae TaxID=2594267 RepID=UPI0012663773|nr:hypothetical protein [Microlunatus speluncae]